MSPDRFDEPVLLAAGTAIDLDNCAREPIHIPGSVQPRGVLVVAQEPDLTISQISANVVELFGRTTAELLGRPIAELVGAAQAAAIERTAAVFGDLRERNPLELVIDINGTEVGFDAILHREKGRLLLVELELATGPRPFSFPNTYQAVRGSVAELNRAAGLSELYDITARAVRELTGFDRVMVYRYDADYNGEVVAEAKRDDLNAFLGLHYPASDIPAQARALYEKNWLRIIDDVNYAPAPILPVENPVTGRPIDLTHATLRSVSPIHIEYLKNMGVSASMSISLMRDGRLWGLIACHHYAGPHLPPYGVRAAAEFLGSTLSLRLVDRVEDDELRTRLAEPGGARQDRRGDAERVRVADRRDGRRSGPARPDPGRRSSRSTWRAGPRPEARSRTRRSWPRSSSGAARRTPPSSSPTAWPGRPAPTSTRRW